MLYNGGFIRNHRVNVIAGHYGLPLTPHSPYLRSTPGAYDTLLRHAAGAAHRDGVRSSAAEAADGLVQPSDRGEGRTGCRARRPQALGIDFTPEVVDTALQIPEE